MLKPLTVKTCTILILFLLQLFWLKRAGLPGRRDPPRPPPTHPPAYPLGSGMRPCPQGFVKHILGITEQTDLSSQLFPVYWLKFHDINYHNKACCWHYSFFWRPWGGLQPLAT